eukprot:TRINITY_DN49848_c0_g1_i1.p1 TRINITY_DN49848_c0_g1~~TRINITY_DN49848_c0_g1_i1.p1  ORF type:complete len:404 (-),score=88.80 TRINITY_DN49848_c0_g1_i1:25-1167(-)
MDGTAASWVRAETIQAVARPFGKGYNEQDCAQSSKRTLADINIDAPQSPRKVAAIGRMPSKARAEESASFAGAEDLQRLLDKSLERIQISEQVVASARCLHVQDESCSGTCFEEEDDDPQRVSEYAGDIFSKLGKDEEDFCCLRPDYMEDQPELCEDERSIAVDWLVEVHVKYKLRTETLFLAVSLVDRFLSMRKVKRDDLQLVVVCANFIAAKFEEIDPPDVRDFAHMTQQACSRQAILSMEVKMLTALEFTLCYPTAVHFLDRYQRASKCNKKHRLLIEYILQLALVDLGLAKYSPSQQVAAALLISSRLTKQPITWPEGLARSDASEHRHECVTRCAIQMCRLLQAAEHSPHQAVRKKFLRPENHCLASLLSSMEAG